MALATLLPQNQAHQGYNPCLLQESYIGELSELRQQASWLSHLVDTLPAGVIVLDGRGMVAKANQIAVNMLGQPLEGEQWFNIIHRAFRPQQDDGHEVSLHDGRRVKLEITPLAPEPGQLILMTDLTETRKLQARVAHMQRLSALGKMVASLAHQVRTPLSAAMLYGAHLGSDSLRSASREKFHTKLMSRLKDLESQVNDMLMFAKSGDHQVVETLSLQSLLSEVTKGSEAMLSLNESILNTVLPEPDITITGNQTALAGAIGNLIQNAIQIKGKGAEITLQAERLNDTEVSISVTDNGPGIKPEDLAHLFQPFYTTRTQGTGLGLAVVNSVANSHKGRVLAENHTNAEQQVCGAKFSMILPIQGKHTD